MTTYTKNIETIYVPIINSDVKQKYESQGYIMESDKFFRKETLVPLYSHDIKKKYIGKDTYESCGRYTSTTYYKTTSEEFEKLVEKPILEKVCIPMRIANYDWFAEVVRKEKSGMGWHEEYSPNVHTTYHNIIVIVDE